MGGNACISFQCGMGICRKEEYEKSNLKGSNKKKRLLPLDQLLALRKFLQKLYNVYFYKYLSAYLFL